MPILYGKHKRCGGTTGARLHWLAQDGHNQRNSHFLLNGYYREYTHGNHDEPSGRVPLMRSPRFLETRHPCKTNWDSVQRRCQQKRIWRSREGKINTIRHQLWWQLVRNERTSEQTGRIRNSTHAARSTSFLIFRAI